MISLGLFYLPVLIYVLVKNSRKCHETTIPIGISKSVFGIESAYSQATTLGELHSSCINTENVRKLAGAVGAIADVRRLPLSRYLISL